MFTVSIQRGPAYLLAVASGQPEVEENCSGIIFVAETLKRTGTRRLLFDMRALAPEYGQSGGLEVVSTLYASMPPMDKIAIVVAAGRSQGFVLEVARHRNVAAQEFTCLDEAEAWLRQ